MRVEESLGTRCLLQTSESTRLMLAARYTSHSNHFQKSGAQVSRAEFGNCASWARMARVCRGLLVEQFQGNNYRGLGPSNQESSMHYDSSAPERLVSHY